MTALAARFVVPFKKYVSFIHVTPAEMVEMSARHACAAAQRDAPRESEKPAPPELTAMSGVAGGMIVGTKVGSRVGVAVVGVGVGLAVVGVAVGALVGKGVGSLGP